MEKRFWNIMFFFSSNAKNLIVLLFASCTIDFSCGLALNDYLKLREQNIKNEEATFFGANMVLDEVEVIANKFLMSIKRREIAEGYQNLSRFWPANDFLVVRKEIEKTESYKILRRMPKGGLLHSHNGKIASKDFIYKNLTTMPNLYVCLDNNTVLFRFFATPDRSCGWRLMKDLYEKSPQTIAYIKEYLTLPKLSTPGYNIDLMWVKFGQMVTAFDPIFLYRPAYEKYIYGTLEELYEDNVMYWEVRCFSDKLYELNGTAHDPIVAVELLVRVIDEFIATHPGFLGVRYIFNVARESTLEEFDREVQIFRRIKRRFPNFVIGFDVSNYEDRTNTNLFYIDKLLGLSNETTFYFHAGETAWSGSSMEENLLDAIMLNAKRIAHGLALTKHPKYVKMIKDKDIAMEVQPLSSQMGYVPDLRNHPSSHFFAQNLSVVVSNDDPGYWEAKGLSYDFYEAFIGIMSRKSDLRSLKQLAINSINYSGLTKMEKERAFGIWRESWKKFVKYLANEYNCNQMN